MIRKFFARKFSAHNFLARLTAYGAAREGNLSIIFAVAALPILIAGGGAIDYSIASRVQTQLNAAADAAILAATTPAMMQKTTTVAQAAATSMFSSQAGQIKNFTYSTTGSNPTITVTDDSVTKPGVTVRTVSLTYQAQVSNAFGKLYRIPTTSFTISASSTATTARNIDFYLLLDNSPSMELPATQAGVDKMNSFGCAFACHENDYSDGEYSTPYPGYGTMDSYTYAKNNGITLRIDNVRSAAQSLASTAQSLMATNGATYRLAAYSFNFDFTKVQDLVATTSANVPTIQTNVGTMTPPLMEVNGSLAGNQNYAYPVSAKGHNHVKLSSNSLYVNDATTDISVGLTEINNVMPTPGNGTNAKGDTPQGVLMLVTDGVNDANLYSSGSCSTGSMWNYSNTYGNFYRCIQPIDTSDCTTIKNRGIRIAVLYTTYFPVPSNGFYQGAVAPMISQVAPALQACASSSDLYAEVTTGQDITAALGNLFRNAVASAAHLTQ